MSLPNSPGSITVQLPCEFREKGIGIWSGLFLIVGLIVLFFAAAVFVTEDKGHFVSMVIVLIGLSSLGGGAWGAWGKGALVAVVGQEGIVYYDWSSGKFWTRAETVFIRWADIADISVQHQAGTRYQGVSSVTFLFRAVEAMPLTVDAQKIDGKTFAGLVTVGANHLRHIASPIPAGMRDASRLAAMPALPLEIRFSIASAVWRAILSAWIFLVVSSLFGMLIIKPQIRHPWIYTPGVREILLVATFAGLIYTSVNCVCWLGRSLNRRPQLILENEEIHYLRRDFSFSRWRNGWRKPGPHHIPWREVAGLQLKCRKESWLPGGSGLTTGAEIYLSLKTVASNPGPVVLDVKALNMAPEDIYLWIRTRTL